MEKNRKLIVFGLIVFFVFLILYLIFIIVFNKSDEIQNRPEDFPVPTFLLSPTLSESIFGERIEVSGVKVDNFYRNAFEVMQNNDVIIKRNSDFQLVYYSIGDYFHLSILNSPFEVTKHQSERELLKILDINEREACQLHLRITTPLRVNPDESGHDYPLSFCQ